MTRAKEELYLTWALDYGGKRLRRVSQFVVEALGKEVSEKERHKTSAVEAIESFAPKKDSPSPKAREIGKDELLNLSYYQIDDYLTCPLKYKFVHILRVPILEHHTVIYGRAMHEAVTKYFQLKMAGKKMELADLLSAFSASFDPQGFLDQRHQEERFRVGRQALIRFFNDEEKRDSKPLYIEKLFSFIFANNKINGRFDRIDAYEDGAVIMDFKTSEVDKQKDADKRCRESDQLAIYAMAYQNIFGVLPVRVELYFLESGLIGSHAIGEGDLDKVKEKINQASRGIRGLNFKASPAYMACTYCAYNQICPEAFKK